jgi:uncharacterized protein YceH (UPF0502 family)
MRADHVFTSPAHYAAAEVRFRPVDADAAEIRVLGCLIEKQRITPDVYPLSLNALRAACNQSTNRDPVVEYDEGEIRQALERLAQRGWARLASGRGSRAAKYRHLLDDALRLDGREMALLCVLMLRGPQTPGELKQRSERLHRFDAPDGVQETLDVLVGRELVARLPRRPGQKEQRYVQLLGRQHIEPDRTDSSMASADASTGTLEARVARLENELERLRDEFEESREGRSLH